MVHLDISSASRPDEASPEQVDGSDRSKKCRILVIVRPKRPHLAADFQRIGQYVREIDEGVKLEVVKDWPHTWLRPCTWTRPTLSLALQRVLLFRPMRGPLYQCWPYSKIQEYRRLEAAEIAVAPWAILRADSRPDLSSFGPVVVVKPAAGGRATGVKLVRPDEVRYEKPVNKGAWRCRDLVVQRFVYTGRLPSHYRVTTFFGEALSCDVVEADGSQAPLPHPEELVDRGMTFDPLGLYPNRQTRRVRLVQDDEVIAFAEQAHRKAFGDVPLLGVDVLREHGTGKLFISEVNAGGSTWHFSTRTGKMLQEANGFCFESQFDAFRKAARILVEQARRYAR